jgi:glycine cleavage system T protein (aminomethyltransferase)
MSGQASGGALKKTPLHALSKELGGRLVDFAGWEMPVQFSSVIEEHMAVRTAAGLFDVSHMGEIEVEGRDALAFVQRVTCNDVSRLATGQAHYSALTTPEGTFVDDILVYRRGSDRFLLVVNAGNTDKDFEWVKRHRSGQVKVENASSRWAQIALQGPKAEAILKPHTPADLRAIAYYHFTETRVGAAAAVLSRTGYTGDDGFEIYLEPAAAEGVARALLDGGRAAGLLPCGLGARDTLRLEAGMPLYGNDIDETTTVLEAGLGWICKTDKGEFIGRDALLRQKKAGLTRRRIGFEMVDRGIARHGYPVRFEGREVGQVTSGTFGPYVKKNIGMAYVPPELSGTGARFSVVIRERDAAAVVVPTPFYRRAH